MGRPQAPAEADADGLARYLLSFHWPGRNEAVQRDLVAGGLGLWRQILRFVPDPPVRGRALELGSPPFHITLLLRCLRNYELSLTGCAVDQRPEIRQELESAEYGERHAFTCACFDIERDPFPYADESFDLVTWCEVIEHLTANPVHALSEIHRVLKAGGWLVISTPNAARAGNIANLLRGGNVYDPYHLGAPLKGSRHSREYTLGELRDLVEGCGFRIDRAEDVDVAPPGRPSQRLLRLLLQYVLGPVTGGHHRSHLFLRAAKTAAPFRWYFPAALFDQAQLAFHVAPRASRVTMGENDPGHATIGWGPLRTGPEGRATRRCGAIGDLYLLHQGTPRTVRLIVSDGHGEAQVWHDDAGAPVLLGQVRFEAPRGEWREIVISLEGGYRPGTPLHVRMDAPGGADVHAVAAE